MYIGVLITAKSCRGLSATKSDLDRQGPKLGSILHFLLHTRKTAQFNITPTNNCVDTSFTVVASEETFELYGVTDLRGSFIRRESTCTVEVGGLV